MKPISFQMRADHYCGGTHGMTVRTLRVKGRMPMEGNMTSKVVQQLYRSRRYDPVCLSFEYQSDVAFLVTAIEGKARERGLMLSRWQTNSRRNSHICTITYVLHTGPRPVSSDYVPEGSACVRFPGLEGTTSRCRAHRELRKLWNTLSSVPVI